MTAPLIDTIRNQTASLGNSIANRREHPTYGYTKASIRHQHSALIGMLIAYAVVNGQTSVSKEHLAAWAAEELDIDLHRIAKEVEGS